MEYSVAYGKTGLTVDISADLDVTVVEPVSIAAAEDPFAAVMTALANPIDSAPLASLAAGGDKVGIVVNDITRHTPTPLLLEAIRSTLPHIPDDDIDIFIATGTHRANTRAELDTMLGEMWADKHKIIQNDALDRNSHIPIGTTSAGNQVWIHKALMACDLRIATGFIEPHIFAGFSGGGKAFLPGMAGMDSILHNHRVENIDHPLTKWGVIANNPIALDIQEAAALTEPAFLLNVTLNQDRQVTRVFAGDMQSAHASGCEFVKETAMVRVDHPFDIVLTRNAGYPLDLNIYQSVKGMSAAAQITRKGGAILLVAECWDGIPEHGEYARMMREATSIEDLLQEIHQPGYKQQDSWQAQIQAQILKDTEIYLHSHLLEAELIRSVKLQPAKSIEETLEQLIGRYGRDAKICVMPDGPLTIPYLHKQIS